MDIESIIREYIDKTVHMSLATSNEGKPWVCEVHFGYDDELNLYWRSLKSRRHSQEIAINPNVAGDIVDKHEVGQSVVGIYFEGTATLLEAGEEQDAAFTAMNNRGIAPNDALADAAKDGGHQFYKVTVENWYAFGRFGQPNGQKYKLEWHKRA
jgi:uncharacterized protein YhbP (UPF0306 family)